MRNLIKIIPDKIYLQLLWKRIFGWKSRPNFDDPRTFNEKIQWLKLHDRKPIYTTLVDKHRVKGWVAEKIGSQYITETYALWERAEDVDVSDLPECFVLKTNHDCGGVVVCRDRGTFDLGVAKRELAAHLKKNYFWEGREWPYKDVKPLVFAEEYLESGGSGLIDYKFHCFNGEPQFLYISQGLENHATARMDFLDMRWKPMGFSRSDYRRFAELPPRPACFDEMAAIARSLSADIPFVRVDLFENAGRPRFSEMTFHPCSGFMPFEPPEWDARLGELLNLSGVCGSASA